MDYKTWDEFWALFLQVTFHQNNSERWSVREKRARWCQTHLGIQQGSAILNIGCGDGLLDICLSRVGMEVTAVDRNPSVLLHAQGEDNTGHVKFMSADLRKLNFSNRRFQAALFLECSGLVKKEEDLQLFKNIYQWLQPGGKFVVDCPMSAESSGSWSKSFASGELTFHHSFDPVSRIFRIEPTFKESGGRIFGLLDPIRDDLAGLSRYYYPKDEIALMLKSVGFKVADAEPHYYEKNYFALVGTK
jgi:SAM-dependent methyltransferase